MSPQHPSLEQLMASAAALRDIGHGDVISYSRKVFVPLSQLCRDVCHYCTFAKTPRTLDAPYMEPEAVLAIARRGQEAGCTEVLFTLGDKPELRYVAARSWLDARGYSSTIDYLYDMCGQVARETGIMPHVNAGIMGRDDILRLREVSGSQGIMLESSSHRLCGRGLPHQGSPDKVPSIRLAMLEDLGRCAVPTTTGILIGIGETWEERLDALRKIRALADRYGHIQEVIVQNFQPKVGTRMEHVAPPSLDDLCRTVAAARHVLGAEANIQVPPNLTARHHAMLIDAGINDWGGVSQVTIDHVNPEAPWPQIEALATICAERGKILVQRLPIYPAFLSDPNRWLSDRMRPLAMRAMDADGLVREDGWVVGDAGAAPKLSRTRGSTDRLGEIVRKLDDRAELSRDDLAGLFRSRGAAAEAVMDLADRLRAEVSGDTVRYVVNRNINYTNICTYSCGFCAFSKGTRKGRGDRPYDIPLEEIARRAREAWDRGATEVCLQGGIHPTYTGETYLEICRAVKDAVPQIHIHAFSPLEVTHGAQTLGLSVPQFLGRLKDAGLSSLPGTAAEILVDRVREQLCPDKLMTADWLDVIAAAHEVGLPTTSTMMFGSVETYEDWAQHLLELRRLQMRTGGITEFVPLPFVASEAPIYLKGRARRGPTWREALLVHAVARIAFHRVIPNIQVSWVKMGPDGASQCLAAGVNDLGGTLMNESISRAAGAGHGQEFGPSRMEALIAGAGRRPMQRDTLYRPVDDTRRRAATDAPALTDVILARVSRKTRIVEELNA